MRAAVAGLIAIAVIGCNGTTEHSTFASVGETLATPSSRPTATPLPTATATACIAAPLAAAAIAKGLTVQGGGTLRNAFQVLTAVEPGFFGYVVAAEIDGPGMEGDGQVGTWAVGKLGSPIFAVNALAQEFSDWGADAADGSAADVARDSIANSAEASTAEDCARGR